MQDVNFSLPASPSSPSQLHQKQQLQIHDWLCQRRRSHLGILVKVQHSPSMNDIDGGKLRTKPAKKWDIFQTSLSSNAAVFGEYLQN